MDTTADTAARNIKVTQSASKGKWLVEWDDVKHCSLA